MREPLARYVFDHYRHLMTEQERLAYNHLAGTMKATLGQSDREAQEAARNDRIHSRWLSNDPEVLRLAGDGFDAFVERTGERIFQENGDKVFLNCCPSCGKLARTPTAKQCRYCGCDWHDKD